MTDHLERLWKFIAKHYAPARAWGRDVTMNWVAWHDAEGRAYLVTNEQAEYIGFGIARPIMRLEQAEDTTLIDPEGGILMIDLLIADDPRAFQAIVAFARRRWGVRPYICFQREGGPFRIYPSARFFRTFDPALTT